MIALVIFLIAVVIAADRIGAVVGAHVLAGKVEDFEHLQNRPGASIGGIPFLTQAFGGKYHDVKITAHEVLVNEVPVTTLTANLHGVHLPFSKAIHGSVSQVPVDRVDGTAYVSFSDANTYLAKHPVAAGQSVQLSPGRSARTVNVTDRVRVAGKGAALTLRGVGLIGVSSNVVTVAVSQLAGTGNPGVPKRKGVPARLRVSLPLQGLPFRLQLNTVTVSSTGMTAVGGATNIVLGARGH
jgi:hypothetical protein